MNCFDYPPIYFIFLINFNVIFCCMFLQMLYCKFFNTMGYY